MFFCVVIIVSNWIHSPWNGIQIAEMNREWLPMDTPHCEYFPESPKDTRYFIWFQLNLFWINAIFSIFYIGAIVAYQGRNQGCSCSCLRDVPIEINLGSTIVLTSITSTTNISLTSFFLLTNTFSWLDLPHHWYFIFLVIFQWWGKPWPNNCLDGHFLVERNVSPRSRQGVQNEARRHLVFSRQEVSMKNYILCQFSRY